MNQLIKIIVCCVLVLQLQAQQKSSNLSNTQKTQNSQNTPSKWQAYKKTTAQSAKQLALNKTALLLNKEDELHLMRKSSDETGMLHYRYQQKYKGIPVEGAVYLMHERAGKVELSNGQLINGLNMNTKPSIDVRQAQKLAIDYIGATQYASLNKTVSKKRTLHQADDYHPNGSLVIVDSQFSQNSTNYRLAYKFEIFATQPLIRKDVYVDALDGKIILALEKLYACTHVDATGTTNYADTVSFGACQQNGVYTLEHQLEHGKLSVRDYSNVEFPVSDSETLFDTNKAANEVFYFTQKTFEYFEAAHGRKLSVEEADSVTTSIVNNAGNNNPNNSFYADNFGVYYGAGDGEKYTSLSSADMVGHELSHGLTKFTADLIYRGQSGALNESFSDIFGEMVEAYCKPDGQNDWIFGADFTIEENKNGVRSLSNPKDNSMVYQLPHTYKKEHWKDIPKDNGGVHFNSGVQNYWFYLLSKGNTTTQQNDHGFQYKIDSIGKEAAAKIAFKNLTEYLTPTAQYIDARRGSIQAAIDLYDADHNIVEQVKAAWDAVGVYDDCRFMDSLVLQNLMKAKIWDEKWKTESIADWPGITISDEGCVSELILNNQITARNTPLELPNEIGELVNLEKIDLSNNGLGGVLPSSIGNLKNLKELNLSYNDFEGSIPAQWVYMDGLKKLDLSNNSLSGCFDFSLMKLCNQLDTISAYYKINEGNQFENKWVDFCIKGDCMPCRKTDSLTLVKLYDAFNGDNWTQGWDFDQPITQWHGVSLDENECVDSLNLQSNNLTGSISPVIGELTSLHYLYLQNNSIEGSMPYELINIHNIFDIDLSNNNLSGCYNANLIELTYKWDDAFYCNNRISDGNNFMASWCDYSSSSAGNCDTYLEMNCRQRDSIALRTIYEVTDGPNWRNTWDLNEAINTWEGVSLDTNGCLIRLDLGNNYLTGFIPLQIGYLRNLEALFLFRNSLVGSIPQNLSDLKNLETLHLQFNSLSGPIPTMLGDLENLEVLFLEHNELDGSLPNQLCNLSKLRVLHLNNNNLTGSIPVEFAELESLGWCELQYNQLSGNIPPELGSLRSIYWLDIQYNQLIGNIPPSFSNMNNLTVFNANNNQLSGCYSPNLDNLCHTLNTLYPTNYSKVSEGNNFPVTWYDFCANETGECNKPVWPGDFNNDGIVNYNDLLYWGLAEGTVELDNQRPNATEIWAAQNSPEWEKSITTSVNANETINVKHQDANGDGKIDNLDLEAFKLNYGKIADDITLPNSDNNDIIFDVTVTETTPSSFTFEISVRSAYEEVDSIDLHGFSASLSFKGFGITDISINDFQGAFPYDKAETFYDNDREIFDISLTKTNQQNSRMANRSIVVSATGCIIIADLPSGDPPTIKLVGGGVLDKTGNFSEVGQSSINPNTIAVNTPNGLPNPLPAYVSVQHEKCNRLGSAKVSIMEGEGIPPFQYNWSTGETGSQINNLLSGFYTVTVSDAIGKNAAFEFQVEGQEPKYYSDGTLKCGSDCPYYLSPSLIINNGSYKASKNINFNGKIEDWQNIEFEAGESINFGIGANIGQVSAAINSCEN